MKDVWGVRGTPDQVGVAEIKKDMFAAGKWIQKKRKARKKKKKTRKTLEKRIKNIMKAK